MTEHHNDTSHMNKRSRWHAYTASCSHCVILMAFRSFVLSMPTCFWLVQDYQNAECGVTTRHHSTGVIVDSNSNERFNWYRTELIEPRRKIVRFLLQHICWTPGDNLQAKIVAWCPIATHQLKLVPLVSSINSKIPGEDTCLVFPHSDAQAKAGSAGFYQY
jgi:hypothetical protein